MPSLIVTKLYFLHMNQKHFQIFFDFSLSILYSHTLFNNLNTDTEFKVESFISDSSFAAWKRIWKMQFYEK